LLRIVECKSYLDNPGVRAKWVEDAISSDAGRFKLSIAASRSREGTVHWRAADISW
jgi:hypothetical protein